jgi:hypothetical protein
MPAAGLHGEAELLNRTFPTGCEGNSEAFAKLLRGTPGHEHHNSGLIGWFPAAHPHPVRHPAGGPRSPKQVPARVGRLLSHHGRPALGPPSGATRRWPD